MRVLFFTLAALGLASPLPIQAQTGLLNDTGSTCETSNLTGQDCHYGRDKAAADGNLPKIGGGREGFDFTKVCNSGETAGQGDCPNDSQLGSGANDWACTRDNVTGLIWEVKVNDATHLRHRDHTYSWFMTASPDGHNGFASDGICSSSGRCDTEKFVEDVNIARLCGANDWRMPTIKELEGIAHLGRRAPAIDTDYFPNTPTYAVWSGSPRAGASYTAWFVDFFGGKAYDSYRNAPFFVLLVRGGQ